MMRRLAIGWIGLCLGAWLAACRPAAAPAGAPAVPQAVRYEGASLTYVGEGGGPGLAIDRALAERFQADTGARIEVIPRALSTSEAYRNQRRRLTRGHADVLLLDVVWAAAFAPRLRDLTSELGAEASAHWRPLVDRGMVGGKLVAMPLYLEGGALFYRPDLLKRYGFGQPPATWDALERMAATIQAGERRRRADFQGFIWQGSPYEGLTCNAMEWQASYGAPLRDPATGRPVVNDARAVAAFRQAAGWIGTISPPWVARLTELDSLAVFRAGDAAFMRNWTHFAASLGEAGSPVRDRFALAPLPHAAGPHRSAAMLGGSHLGVSAASAHPAAAVAFVRYMTSPEVQAWRVERGGYLPTRPALYRGAPTPAMRALKAAVPHFVVRPSRAWEARYEELSRLYAAGVYQILQGEDPAIVARLMAQDIATYTASAGKPGVVTPDRLQPPWAP